MLRESNIRSSGYAVGLAMLYVVFFTAQLLSVTPECVRDKKKLVDCGHIHIEKAELGFAVNDGEDNFLDEDVNNTRYPLKFFSNELLSFSDSVSKFIILLSTGHTSCFRGNSVVLRGPPAGRC